jgi:hypothetical protein
MVLSLVQARVCLDCDCLTTGVVCPKCDRDSTLPLSAWFRPLKENPLKVGGGSSPGRASRRWIIVIQHGQGELYRFLRHALADTGVEVVYERRVGQRRRLAAPRPEDRRRADRRQSRPAAQIFEGVLAPPSPEARPARDRARQPAGVRL